MNSDLKQINILIPSAGFASRDLLEHIVHHPLGNYRLVLTDMNPDIGTKTVASKFYKAPATAHEDYLPFILKVCQKESIHIVMPGKSADAKFFATHETIFKEKGIAVILSPQKTIFETTDKFSAISVLKKEGLSISDAIEVNNIEQFNKAIIQLGYPEKPICIKPSKYPEGSGRGFRIIDSSQNVHRRMFWEQPSELYYVTLEQVLTAMKHEVEFPPLLVMEYLPNEEYSVYCFCDQGIPVYIVPNRRISLYQMSTLEADIDFNKEIIELSRNICNAFHFEYMINIQLKYSFDRKPKLIEINPRLAGSIMLPVMAGVDMVHFAIQKGLGNSFSREAKAIEGFKIKRELTPYYYET